MIRASRWAIALICAGGCLPAQLNPLPEKLPTPEPPTFDVTKPSRPSVQAADVNERNARDKARELADELSREG